MPCTLSETAANIVENVACRVAERHGGRITPNHIIPYLPLSLRLVRDCLDAMADGSSVESHTDDGIVSFEFSAYRDSPAGEGPLAPLECVGCGVDLKTTSHGILCTGCSGALRDELNALAEKNAWPAEAVYEHEILYLAARQGNPCRPAKLAGQSRYTLRSLRRKLDRLTVDGYARQELDSDAGITLYSFPELEYPKSSYRRNMDVIRTYPASIMEELQLKLVRIVITLGLLLLGFFCLAFWAIPPPILVPLYVVVAAVVSCRIWRHRDAPPEL